MRGRVDKCGYVAEKNSALSRVWDFEFIFRKDFQQSPVKYFDVIVMVWYETNIDDLVTWVWVVEIFPKLPQLARPGRKEAK